ncbi:MAG: RidA family protein [Acidobacteria bacterium]|nr:RidA family protein [Acidobacteriota bacterium]
MRLLIALSAVVFFASAVRTRATRRLVVPGPPKLPFSAAVSADGLIYLAGALGTGADIRIVDGGIRAQTRQALDNLDAALRQAGSSLPNAVSVHVYLRDAADVAAMNEVYRAVFPDAPPARTTVVVDALALPEAIVEISLVAVPEGAERRVVLPGGWLPPASPYSYGIRTGRTLFLSGLVSRNAVDHATVPGSVSQQTGIALGNAKTILEAAGMSLADVVSSRVFLPDMSTFEEMNGAYRTWFPAAPPARATAKAGLTAAPLRVEITLVAVEGAERRAFTTPNADGTPGTPNPNLSAAIRTGNRLYLAGIAGNAPGAKDDVRTQTAEALARIGRTLHAAGFDWPDVVDGIVYLRNMSDFAQMNAAYTGVLTAPLPARATVGVDPAGAGALVELMLTAVK